MAEQAVKAGKHGKPMAGYKTETEKDVKFAEGGTTKMFPQQAAESVTDNGMAGHTGDPTRNDDAPGAKFAAGGKSKMFGYNPSQMAKAGITSAR